MWLIVATIPLKWLPTIALPSAYDYYLTQAKTSPAIIPDQLLVHPDFMYESVQPTWTVILFAPPDVCNSYFIMHVVVEQNGMALAYASNYLRDDPTIAMTAIGQNWQALQLASWRLRDDQDFILTAVAQNGRALQFASPRLRANFNVALAALRNNRDSLCFASERMQRLLGGQN